MRWGHDFLRMREWGIGRVGKFPIGQSPTLGKTFFEFLGKENTKNGHLSLMRKCFTFAHDWDWKKCFLETQLGIHVGSRNEKILWVWTIMSFSYPAIWIVHVFGFCVMIFPLFGNFVLSRFPLSASHFLEPDCPTADLVSLIWKTSNVFVFGIL